jgi:hypothetical protein
MARGKITNVVNATGTTGVGITVTSTGATGSSTQGITTPTAGQVLTGTLIDDASNTQVNFAQSLGAELGIQNGSKVDYTTVNTATGPIANVVKLVHRGVITVINPTNDGGTLTDRASNTPMPFQQQYVSESGIAIGSKVNFERVVDPVSGNFTAVALVLAAGA